MQQQEQAASVAVTLRAIAAWLESHPEIEPHYIELPVMENEFAAIKSYEHKSVYAATLLVQGCGLEPLITPTGEDNELFRVSAWIAPGIRVDLVGPA